MTQHNISLGAERRRKGQTLAEFALTLPILLVLTFGIIEFGRMFQSWVTIQNAVREATRYATTGQYNDDKYNLEALLPCVVDDGVDERGSVNTVEPNPIDLPGYTIEYYDGGRESLFATWYDGTNCEPGKPEHLDLRKDLLRIASIMDVARQGAAGLSLQDNPRDGSLDTLVDMLYGEWNVPLIGHDTPKWLDIQMCSSRGFLNSASTPIDPLATGRFHSIYEDVVPAPAYAYGYNRPYCQLNEINPDSPIHNEGLRWLDPGNPGDRIEIFLTYNHPLITPLGLAEYVPMHAIRSGVNEDFRQSRALEAVQGAPPGLGGVTNTPLPPSPTATQTNTSTPSPTISATPSDTPTPTPEPFSCDSVHVDSVSFFGVRVFFNVTNFAVDASELQRVVLKWNTPPAAPGLFLASEAFRSEVFWQGSNTSGNFDTATLTGNDLDLFNQADRTVPGFGQISTWEGVYNNAGTNNLRDVMDQWDFGGSEFYFFNPTTGGQCQVILELPDPPTDPDDPDNPNNATPTYTPDCAGSTLRVEFDRFDTFGVVVLKFVNNSNQPAPLLGFNVDWPDPTTFSPPLARGVMELVKISVGGSNADDTMFGTVIWDYNTTTQDGDDTPDTTHNEGAYFRNNYAFPPNVTTPMYIDFSGTSSRLNTAFGVGAWMFNQTWFDIDCGRNGGQFGGGGLGANGNIFLAENTPPAPTNTPRPTNTPGPTLTPSPTRPSPTPSKTWTPGPTRTPSKTPTITPFIPPTRTPVPTSGDGPPPDG